MKFDVLIIDDDELVLENTKYIVENLGHSVVTFVDPLEAVEYLRFNSKKICLILSDFKMPNLNGFELKEILTQSVKEAVQIPFVIITGFFDKEMAVIGMSLGVQAFLDKPINEEELKSIIDKSLVEREEALRDEVAMIESFLDESASMLDDIERLILEIEENPDDAEILNTYFRLLHTIKGTASCVGLPLMAEYTHKYEDYISDLRQGKFAVSTDVISILLAGLDHLKKCFTVVREVWSDSTLEPLTMASIFVNRGGNVQAIKPKTSSQPTTSKKSSTETTPNENDEKITVSMDLLDHFMEMSGELTVIRNSIVKTVKSIEHKHRGDKDLDRLNDLLSGMNKITSVMQNQVSDLRKVPVKTVFRPMKRLVRDVSKELKKEVELISEGEDLLVDNVVAKILGNSLVHLLRNSLDHGIENSTDRSKSGKNLKGSIFLKVFLRGEDIVVEIKDDGKGIDPEIIRKKSVEKNLYSVSDLNSMTENEILAIIFDAGFSTAQVVSDLSGRGVGMDMVKRSIEGAGGKIFIESSVGVGTTFTLVIPVPKSVLIINSLLLVSAGQTFVIPTDVIAEVLSLDPLEIAEKVLKIENGSVLSHKDTLFPLINLSTVLKINNNFSQDTSSLHVVIVKFKKTKYALVVDQIDEFEDVVIKNISHKIKTEGIFKGASLLGNGSLALILDIDGIAASEKIEQRAVRKVAEEVVQNVVVNEYILFSLNSASPFCFPLSVVHRLEKFPGHLIEFSAENMLIQYRSSVLPLYDLKKLVLGESDGEDWPTLDYVDVIVIENKGKLFGVLVSHIEDIGVSTSSLNTDIVAIQGALGTTLIDHKVITVLDVFSLIESMNFVEPLAEAS